jgi:site-specific recombinase XerD
MFGLIAAAGLRVSEAVHLLDSDVDLNLGPFVVRRVMLWHERGVDIDQAMLASKVHGDLAEKHISPHTIRHTTAMHLLQSGVDMSVIALWLGHESPSTHNSGLNITAKTGHSTTTRRDRGAAQRAAC